MGSTTPPGRTWKSPLEGPPGWRCTAAPAVPPETLGSRPGPVATSHDREVRGAKHNWPSVVWVREGLAGRDILVSSRTSDSCGGPGAVRANQGCQVNGVSSDTLVRLASGLDTLFPMLVQMNHKQLMNMHLWNCH